jgi:hypothetical protein
LIQPQSAAQREEAAMDDQADNDERFRARLEELRSRLTEDIANSQDEDKRIPGWDAFNNQFNQFFFNSGSGS